MELLETALATADGIRGIASRFMVDGATYQRGAEIGFSGLDFYVVGRGGALGDVDADVVSAAFVFFEPAAVRTMWDEGRKVMPGVEASQEFLGCGHAWAESHFGDDLDVSRLADLAGRVAAGASPAGAPLFAATRALEGPTSPRARALHQLDLLRELRNAMHGAAVLAAGLAPLQAMAVRSPGMIPMFGWTQEAPDPEPLRARWEAAEAATDLAVSPAFAVLEPVERAELVELIAAADAATA